MVEDSGLLIRRSESSTVGSNPTRPTKFYGIEVLLAAQRAFTPIGEGSTPSGPTKL